MWRPLNNDHSKSQVVKTSQIYNPITRERVGEIRLSLNEWTTGTNGMADDVWISDPNPLKLLVHLSNINLTTMLDWRRQGRKMRWYPLSLVLGRNRLKAWREISLLDVPAFKQSMIRFPGSLDFQFWYPFNVLPSDARKLSRDVPKRRSVRQSYSLLASGLNFKCRKGARYRTVLPKS